MDYFTRLGPAEWSLGFAIYLQRVHVYPSEKPSVYTLEKNHFRDAPKIYLVIAMIFYDEILGFLAQDRYYMYIQTQYLGTLFWCH